ncbi:uncharacterized protein MONOS_1951 [Monocercomonoides exilis]|uniref:uncharacterized protein n=1 Tax=Monocercomonoides exilis TaxID=2049356 RepID=UPI00355AA9C4|nr:hypothetical protein MONOS_1951 [Monocercomonoides exilis]|eukprot:MONOS_1951.1-p1 / transcript=MONOS_1951.1 / gene=MONOS_1951 / organism=Monocercomonoides_exilis_PA203 / gene_product=unspecified product / transcript_product=unspecified product / location=Mono_scaffold00037:130586-131195(+) / protein_length=129 / sequence_SO=supercontig / SO=protein_coding / is_pseudo=false
MVCGHNQFVNCSSLSGCGGSAVITGFGYDCYFVDLSKLFKDKSCISGSFSTTDSPNRVWWDGGDESCECGGWINHGVTVLYVDEKQGIDDIGCGFPTNFGKPCKTLQFSIEAPSHWNTNQIDVSSGTQ